MSRRETVDEALDDLEKIKSQVNNILYYSEGEDLLKREDKPKGWNALEIIFHMNQVNAHYLLEIDKVEPHLAASHSKNIKLSWLGKKMVKSLGPRNSAGKLFKISSPAKVHPLKLKAKGRAIVEDVVFREFLRDLDNLEKHLKQLNANNYDEKKIKTLLPFLKINAAEGLLILVQHTLRHMEQLERLLKPASVQP